MRLSTREEFAASPEEVLAVLTDQTFQETKCAETTDGGHWSVEIDGTGTARTVVTTERELPTDGLPDVARSLLGSSLVVVERHTWSAVGGDGSRVSILDLHVKGAPLTLKGTLTLSPAGDGTVQVLDAELKANLPFIGKKIEEASAPAIRRAIEIETDLLREALARA